MLDGLPDAVLGAIVIGAVLSLVKPRRLWGFRKRSPYHATLAYVTFLATLISPPNIHYAVLVGIALTVVLHLTRPFHLETNTTESGGLELRPRGLLWVATNGRFAGALVNAIEDDPGSGPVTINLDRSTAIDSATGAAIVAGQDIAVRSGRGFAVSNTPRGADVILEGLGVPVLVNDERP